mmetsp:Transcript_48740/g.93245  ORF Transcript_48740/g.93245 Transcript_48740/m.93245 type:complete len:267 (+) Transcript_48740:710-1510(+)
MRLPGGCLRAMGQAGRRAGVCGGGAVRVPRARARVRRLLRRLPRSHHRKAAALGGRRRGHVHGGGLLRAGALHLLHQPPQPRHLGLHGHRHHRRLGGVQRARHHRSHGALRGPGVVPRLEAAGARRALLPRLRRFARDLLRRRQGGAVRGGCVGGRVRLVRGVHEGEQTRVWVDGLRGVCIQQGGRLPGVQRRVRSLRRPPHLHRPSRRPEDAGGPLRGTRLRQPLLQGQRRGPFCGGGPPAAASVAVHFQDGAAHPRAIQVGALA